MSTLTTQPDASQRLKDREEREAITYVKNLKAFHMHWITFVVMMPALYGLNQWLTPSVQWVQLVAMAWGAALILNAILVFGIFRMLGADWEQREFKRRINSHHR